MPPLQQPLNDDLVLTDGYGFIDTGYRLSQFSVHIGALKLRSGGKGCRVEESSINPSE